MHSLAVEYASASVAAESLAVLRAAGRGCVRRRLEVLVSLRCVPSRPPPGHRTLDGSTGQTYHRRKVSKTKPGKVPVLSKAERRARQLAGLRPAKKGEVRNPLGKNGRERSDYIVGVLSELDRGQPRIRRILLAGYRRSLRGSDVAFKALVEQWGGKARQQLDLTSSDRSMSPHRRPTTAEDRQTIDRLLEMFDKPDPAHTESTAGEAPATEADPKAKS